MKDMELKRYLLLKNNILVDSKKENILDTKYVTATSNNVFDLVRENDYVMVEGNLYKVCRSYFIKNDKPYGVLMADGLRIKWQSNEINKIVDYVERIYKWQDKHLLCAWEKENEKI